MVLAIFKNMICLFNLFSSLVLSLFSIPYNVSGKESGALELRAIEIGQLKKKKKKAEINEQAGFLLWLLCLFSRRYWSREREVYE